MRASQTSHNETSYHVDLDFVERADLDRNLEAGLGLSCKQLPAYIECCAENYREFTGNSLDGATHVVRLTDAEIIWY